MLPSELELPENVILIFQLPTQPEFNSGWKAAVPSAPPYSPEVNPIERFWQEIKKALKWELFPDLEELRKRLSSTLSKLSSQAIAQVTGWNFILDALFVANI
jgi:putative transposase